MLQMHHMLIKPGLVVVACSYIKLFAHLLQLIQAHQVVSLLFVAISRHVTKNDIYSRILVTTQLSSRM